MLHRGGKEALSLFSDGETEAQSCSVVLDQLPVSDVRFDAELPWASFFHLLLFRLFMQNNFSLVASPPLSAVFICSYEQFVFLGAEPSVEFWHGWVRSPGQAGSTFGCLGLVCPRCHCCSLGVMSGAGQGGPLSPGAFPGLMSFQRVSLFPCGMAGSRQTNSCLYQSFGCA